MENASGTTALSFLTSKLLWTVSTFSFFWELYICIACEMCDASRINLESQVGDMKIHFYDVHHFSSSFALTALLLEQLCIFSKLVTFLTSLEDIYEYVLTPK